MSKNEADEGRVPSDRGVSLPKSRVVRQDSGTPHVATRGIFVPSHVSVCRVLQQKAVVDRLQDKELSNSAEGDLRYRLITNKPERI